jgi:hypothetical protein
VNHELASIEYLMAGGEVLPTQARSLSTWTPEKRLAGAVLASALVNVRDHHGDPHHADDVEEDLAWIRSDEPGELFDFQRLCDVFDLDAAWVRETVERWCRTAPQARRAFSLSRDAA